MSCRGSPRLGLFLLCFRLGRGVDVGDVLARYLDDDELGSWGVAFAPMLDLRVVDARSGLSSPG